MKSCTLNELRSSFKKILNEVSKDHAPTLITRRNGKRVVMVSESEYNSMQETLHLLGSAKNAERLRESVAEFKVANPKKNRASAVMPFS
ncbi:type II toxin-antitoxin system Phd/YefM family antitoxin [Caballeronia sp. SEWSISQ10-4 2]|uniref:type II toxin-antitoxin system Phd/YefM family antitoxin n=1 Tax=Caballeronia sp. SEWSISQ10-4 2 TaxID=2937438 RepID=UPI00264BFDF5|nr:type II toxin-antitoxin system Phd/YefM family antitoxin [Caballeronia sp. SEWSISQ10-4 2]MDN7183951.1 type II toxin-antitoxin system Phd/YefM family antitoxin [Caballeronia sp. SEWSISQ10-4 2]